MHKGRNAVRVTVAAVLTAAAVGVASPASAGPGANDFSGDNRADLMALYDYGNGEAGLLVFPGAPQAAEDATDDFRTWHAPAGNFWSNHSKITSGDFNGDNHNDALIMYDYGNGSAGLWVIPGSSNATPDATGAYMVWETPPGNFWLNKMKITAGDFNNDGKDDLLALYDYDHESAGLWVFPGVSGSGTNPYMVWETGPGNFAVNAAKITAGDFNLDGRDDLVALYDYGSAAAGLWIFPGGSGATNPYMVWETGPGNFDVRTVHTVDTDDLDADGTVDLIAITGGGTYRFSGTTSTSGGTQPTPYTWNSTYWPTVVGDYDGNGVVDLITLVHQGNGTASLWVMSGGLPINQPQLWVRVWDGDLGAGQPKVA
ncbi:VCBS repeat-containing protein [Actinomycetes bacterium KLBMP 9797]